MSNLDFDDKVAGALRVRYELRNAGEVIARGDTGGKAAWLDHPRFGVQNTIKRVKSALGWRWNVKTEKHEGDGDICRKLTNGNTLHIWIIRTTQNEEAKTAIETTAEMVLAGQLDRAHAYQHARRRWPSLLSYASDEELAEAIEDAVLVRELAS